MVKLEIETPTVTIRSHRKDSAVTMSAEHEYSIIGHRRWKAAFYLSVLSGAITGLATYGLKSSLVEFAKRGLWDVPPVIIWPITGAVVFGILYVLFDRYVWRFWGISHIIKVPNLSGEWIVSGQTFDADKKPIHKWEATMIITQLYEKISIRLKTAQSSSRSVSAAIIPEAGAGFRLIYSYQNEPRVGEPELGPHIGHCELVFDPAIETAAGDYFNSGGRTTFGQMEIRKKVHG